MTSRRQVSLIRGIQRNRHFLYILGILLVTVWIQDVARAAITWDADGNSQWWFDPENWSESEAMRLPPTSDADNDPATPDISVTDAQINLGTGAWDQGDGVVYDPAHDPFFTAAQSLLYPDGYGPEKIEDLYISRNTAATNRLTIKSGNLFVNDDVQVGRSSGTAGVATDGIIVQTGGTVTFNSDLDLGTTDTSHPGYGNATYDYRGGIFLSDPNANTRVRLSAGGSAGTGGEGRIIMHNPASGGYVRMRTLLVGAFSGAAGQPDGINTGIGTLEFHYENGGTRPIQIAEDLVLANGTDSDGDGVRSSRLDLRLDAAPTVDGSGVPQNLGLIDVDFGDSGFGLITAPGGTPGSLGITFSSVNDPSTALEQGDMVSASFGGTQYNWTISYTGRISWTDADNSVVNTISGTGGVDVVLMGLSSESVSVTGDYNNDGKVDAADYVLWRKSNINGAQGYTDWRANFGAGTSGSGSVARIGAVAVPEPTSLSLLVLCGVISAVVARRER